MAGTRTMLVMEYVEGGDLWRALQRGAPGVSVWRAQGRRVALDIARGLCFLHARNIVYAPPPSRSQNGRHEGWHFALLRIARLDMAHCFSFGAPSTSQQSCQGGRGRMCACMIKGLLELSPSWVVHAQAF